VLDRPPLQGWRTTDEDEVALRRWRGRTEISAVEPIEPEQPIFGAFRVRSASGNVYVVEIRNLETFINSCDCLDHRANGLGTCKHIEGVLAELRRNGGRTFRVAVGQGSPRVEVFLDRREGAAPSLAWPVVRGRAVGAARRLLASFFGSDGALARDPKKIEALISSWRVAPASVRRQVRISRHFAPWLDRQRRERSREEARACLPCFAQGGMESRSPASPSGRLVLCSGRARHGLPPTASLLSSTL
jgi:hypothetical protein